MCILFFIVNGSPTPGGYKLILASNRDEYFARPTLAADRWTEDTRVIGGRDNEPGKEGGTWLGLADRNNQFRVAALLNIIDAGATNTTGRGFLVTDYLKGDITCTDYIHNIVQAKESYQGFNFIAIEIDKDSEEVTIRHCCNNESKRSYANWDQDLVLAFGNSPPEKPLKKVCHGKRQFTEIIETVGQNTEDKMKLVESLLSLLSQNQKHWPDEELVKMNHRAPEMLSSINVRVDNTYGTRTHTIMLIDANNKMDYIEHTMDELLPEGAWKKTHIKNY